MVFNVGSITFRVSLVKAFFLILGLLITVYTATYWFSKVDKMLTDKTAIPEWLPKKVLKETTAWGTSISAKNDLLIIPCGKKHNVKVWYDTNIKSISGFWGARPSISFPKGENIKYTLKTVEPKPSDTLPGSALQQRVILPYLLISLDVDKSYLHKIIDIDAKLDLSYPQVSDFRSYEYLSSTISRKIQLYIVSPKEYSTVKKIVKPNTPEGVAIPYIKAILTIIGLLIIYAAIKKSIIGYNERENAQIN